ncbi:MAG TPA: DNA polymerase IV [Gammaproteobacteria bacterium]|nr:DNA polymerase IV [Gammaproteobacteria bacterium]
MAARRIIVHADMDAFYASVEQRDRPELRGKPLLIGPPGGRGVVLTASYEARPFRVGSAMPMAEARRRCPQAIIVAPRFEHYRAVSKTIMATFREFSGDVEALSLDEAFIDMTGAEGFFGDAEAMARRIKAAVHEATAGLTVSVGVSATKYVAKVASGFAKPDGLTVVPEESARGWLAPLPVAKLWGAGAKTQARLHEAGFETIGQIAAASPAALRERFGSIGEQFHRLANACDDRAVVSGRAAKSISWERTFESDVAQAREVEYHVRKAAEQVAARLRREQYRANGVRVKLKTNRFRILTRQLQLATASQDGHVLATLALRMLPELLPEGPFRLIGVGAYALEKTAESEPQGAQLGLLEDESARRSADLERALDALDARFGADTVRRGGEWLRTRDLGVAYRPESDD